MSIYNNIKYDPDRGVAKFSMKVATGYQVQSRIFFSCYEQDEVIIVINGSNKKLKNKKERVCRFCGKSNSEVSFKKRAHFIPELLGNKELFSDFECDDCNYEFGLLENELANFLGPLRTLSMRSGKKGIPTFKSPKNKLIIREEEKGILKFSGDSTGNSISQNDEGQIVALRYEKHPYCGLMVYKCFVKIALSLIKENEITDYNESIKFIKSKDLKAYQNSLFAIHQYFIPGPHINFPILFSYKKKPECANNLVPFRTFVIYFSSQMIQFFVPFDPKDDVLNKPNSSPQVPVAPPLVDQEWINKYGSPISSTINLDSIERKNNGEEHIRIKTFNKKN